MHNSLRGSVRRSAFVLMPCLAASLLAIPLVIHGLPDYESHLGEEYQPLKTFKFFQSHGREFHKWGPADNFLYAPGYALSLLYWKHEGLFGPSSNKFPYGFHRPLPQLTALILQSRLLLLSLVLASLAALGVGLVRAGFSREAAFFALLLCAATNPVMIWHAVLLKGDGPMIAFGSLALGMYVVIARRALTVARAFWLSTFIAWAMTAKESAIALFALPCAALVFRALRRPQSSGLHLAHLRSLAVGVAALLGWYALLNVVYAPATWLKRIQYVLSGSDPEIWGASGRSPSDFLLELFESLANNLGPGGVMAAVGSIAVLIWLRPRRSWWMSLPFVSFLFLGLLPTGYFPDRFALPGALALVPLIACAVDALRERIPSRSRQLRLGLAALGGINLLYANIAWLELRSTPEDLIETYVREHVAKEELFAIFSFWPRIPGKSRLESFGYRLDSRPIATVIRSQIALPKTVFITAEQQRWVEDFVRRPKRAAMVAEETGFEPNDWECFKGLGYRLADRLSSPLPLWYPFGFLSLPADSTARAVLVYRLD
jgi:hypothetical protein